MANILRGKVVHCKKESFDVYIGRPGPWGNPFEMKQEADRDKVIEDYKQWLWKEIKEGNISRKDLADLHGKTLGCWCAPKACHGDVLLNAAEWAAKQQAA